jgi:cytochrome P450
MLSYDPADPAVRRDPFPLFRQLRERDPVHWSEPLGGWVLTRYADVRMATQDPRFTADRIRPFFRRLAPEERARYPDLERYITGWAVFFDPPGHTRLRRLMTKAFTPRAVTALAGRIQEIVDDLIDRVAERGALDLIADFAYPIPASVVMVMLGVPLAELDAVKGWSDEMALFVGSARLSPDKYARAQAGMREMADYFRRLVAERRAHPREDLVSAMLQPDAEGDALGEDELIAACSLLLFAGHETTTNLIGNGIWALDRHPAEKARLLAAPALIAPAVEEMLRWDGPSNALVRLVGEDLVLGGKELRRGERVFAMMNAANRDPAEFPDPDRFDVAREPNRHLTFAAGIHFCLGAPLARLEAQIAVSTLLRRLPDLRLVGDEPEWLDSMILRGIRSLPARFLPAAANHGRHNRDEAGRRY